MKKTKLISLILAVLMLATMLPMFALTSSATTTTQSTNAMPTTTPDGKASYSVAVTDYSHYAKKNNITGSYANDYFTIASYTASSGDRVLWYDYDAGSETKFSQPSINGVKGIMIPVNTTSCNSNVKIQIRILISQNTYRHSDGVKSTTAHIWSCAKWGTSETKTRAYLYSDGSWGESAHSEISGTTTTLTLNKNVSGYYYIPMNDFYYLGASAGGANSKNTSMEFEDAVKLFSTDYVASIGIHTENGENAKIGNVCFVYDSELPEAADENAVSRPLTLDSTLTNEVSAAATVNSDNELVISRCNASATSGNVDKVWVYGNTTKNAFIGKEATGIRFHIDTSALANEEIAVNPRIRFLIDNIYVNGTGYYVWNSDGTAAGTELATGGSGDLQGVCHSPDSVLYYYDNVTGEPKPLKLTSDIIEKNNNNGADLFEALPVGYVGDIFIPFESFDISPFGSPYAAKSLKWVDMISIDGTLDKAMKMCIAHGLTATPTGDQTVIYKDFEIVYENTAIDNISVTVKNDLSMNLYAKVDNGATNVKVLFNSEKGTRTIEGVKQANGLYKFSYDGILPQNMIDTFDITLTADIGGKTATKTIEDYSVRAYLEALLAQTDDADLKKLIVDMLLYGDAAQRYAGYKTDDLASKNLTATDLLFASAEVNKDAIASVKAVSGTAADGYSWNTANLQLGSYIAVKLGVTAPAGTVVVATIDGNETECTISGGYAIFDNIGAYQLGETIIFTFKNADGTVGQTFTYSVNDYIKDEIGAQGSTEYTQALVKALYNYGVSAAAYNS